MKIVFLIKGDLEKNVPIITQISIARRKEYDIHVICTNCNVRLAQKIEGEGIHLHLTSHQIYGYGILRKMIDWVQIRIKFRTLLRAVYTPGDVIYVGSVDTALAIGKILFHYDYIFHIRELYDKQPVYRYFMKKYAKNAMTVIVPEFNRANILMNWLRLKSLPIVVPNKPYGLQRRKNLLISDQTAKKIIDSIKGKKIILYQGHIGADRNIDLVAIALQKIKKEEFVLVLMGPIYDNFDQRVQDLYTQTYVIPYIPAPFHLEITSYAHMGVVTYDTSSLNQLFCAPNKIYEYAAFDIPMIASDIPGLKYTVGYSGAGLCANFNNPDEIVDIILRIDLDYDRYAQRSRLFFESIDMEKLFDTILLRNNETRNVERE